MSIRCNLGIHDRVHLGEPFRGTGPIEGTQTIIDHCDRCLSIIGIWVWYNKHWSYFKR